MWKEKDIEKSYSDGDVIIRQGDQGREMFIIQKGAVEVATAVDGREIILATLTRGDFFGEMSLLEKVPRSATVRAKAATTLLVLNTGSLLLKIRRDPTFAFDILKKMSQRVRKLNEMVVAVIDQSKLSPEEISNIIM